MKKYSAAFFCVAIVVLICIAVTATFSFTKSASTSKSMKGYTEEKGFAVMELFTSQGCSSCPPADELLGKYNAQQNSAIIPIAFHVDYWDRLGWKDSFSQAAFSQRQHGYARVFNSSSVYTPQLVINGATEMAGGEEGNIAKAVAKALQQIPATTITVSKPMIAANTITVYYNTSGIIENTAILGMLVQNAATTKVKAGENNGATLISYNVVRDIASSTAKNTGSFTLSLPPNTLYSEMGIVVIAQNKTSLKITGAVKKAL